MSNEPWQIPQDKPRDADDLDREAFFAIGRGELYLGALAVLVAIAAAAALFFLLARLINIWVIPLIFASHAALILVLKRSAKGRGFLLTFGRGYQPRTQLIGAMVLTALATAGVVYLSVADLAGPDPGRHLPKQHQ